MALKRIDIGHDILSLIEDDLLKRQLEMILDKIKDYLEDHEERIEDLE